MRFTPVQGPSGPHLFRFSSASAEFDFKNALQMSPIIGPKSDPFPLDDDAFVPNATPSTATFLGGLSFEAAFEQTVDEFLDDPEAHIKSWSTQEVIDWMYDTGLDASLIESFAHHDINGTVLLDLEFEDLKELDIQSFGKRHQLWTAICSLRGDDDNARLLQNASHDTSRPGSKASRRSASRTRSRQSGGSPVESEPLSATRPESAGASARRGRIESDGVDNVLPAQAVSIVAIEQLLPKAHQCAKGENCSKWRKQQRQLKQLKEEYGITRLPTDTAYDGRIVVSGNCDSPASNGEVHITNPHLLQPSVQECIANIPFRPTSEAMPSVVASSGLFGLDQTPEFAIHQGTLGQLGSRDPQDNVKQFLNFQHMNSPLAPPVDDFPLTSPTLEMFPTHVLAPFPAAQSYIPEPSPASRDQPRALPKLNIPRSASAGPQVSQPLQSAESLSSQDESPSPVAASIYRLGTPASEMDVPYIAAPMVAPARDASQSVPPNMQFNQPKRLSNSRTSKQDWRRPSMTLPALKEGEVLPSQEQRKPSNELARSKSTTRRRTLDPAKDEPETKHFGYGPDCSHAGWMRKRKTKMLRHEWQESHFRLKGTQLAMHENARLSSQARETIDVDKYAVACATVASNSKLSAAMKVFHIKMADSEKSKDKDDTAFAFQLVPNAERKLLAGPSLAKTHHFAVNSKDDRIDWMRELMLAKARQQKGNGYEVQVNGQAVEA
jgi:hypothetical protein